MVNRIGRRSPLNLQQLRERNRILASGRAHRPGPAVTISYQTGSGEHEVARRLAELLQAAETNPNARWKIFDGQLVERTLLEHHLPETMAKRMPEDRRSCIDDILDELLGLRPPSWIIVPQIAETIRHLIGAGYVILVGRGANFVAAQMSNVLHVRLVASLPARIARVQALKRLTPKEAAKQVARSDRGHRRYARAHFHARADDELNYHCVINTDQVPCPAAAQLIADAVRQHFGSARQQNDSPLPGRVGLASLAGSLDALRRNPGNTPACFCR